MSTALMERQPFCTLSCRRSSDRTAPVYLPAAISTTLANPLREGLRVQKFRPAGINCLHKTLDHKWFEANTVLEVSFHNVLFFSILVVIMAGIKTRTTPLIRSTTEAGWPRSSAGPSPSSSCSPCPTASSEQAKLNYMFL